MQITRRDESRKIYNVLIFKHIFDSDLLAQPMQVMVQRSVGTLIDARLTVMTKGIRHERH